MINPITSQQVGKKRAEYIEKLREVRRGATKQARSGHPGRRAEAQRTLAEVPKMIRKVYIDDAYDAPKRRFSRGTR